MNMNGKGLAFQTDSFQTNVDQDLSTGLADQADSVAGLKHHINGCITRSVDLAVGGLNGNAIAQQTFCKGGVGYFGDRHSLTGHRRINFLQLLAEQFIKKTHSILVPFLF